MPPPFFIAAIDTVIGCEFRFIQSAHASSAYHSHFLASRFHIEVTAIRISFSILYELCKKYLVIQNNNPFTHGLHIVEEIQDSVQSRWQFYSAL